MYARKIVGTSPEKDINGLERRRTKRKRFGKHRYGDCKSDKFMQKVASLL